MKSIATDPVGGIWIESRFKGYIQKYHTMHQRANNASWLPCRYLDILSLVVSNPAYYPTISLYEMENIYKEMKKHYANFARLISRWNDYRYQFSVELEWFYNYLVEQDTSYNFQGYLPEFTAARAFKDPEMGVIKSFANAARGWKKNWTSSENKLPKAFPLHYIDEYRDSVNVFKESIKEYRAICIVLRNSLAKHEADFQIAPSGFNADSDEYQAKLKILNNIGVDIGRSGRAITDYIAALDLTVDKLKPDSSQMQF